MVLKDLNIKIKYSSDNNNILNDFYIPVLTNSIYYYRLSGFFSSSTLASAAQGMEDFIKNGGEMKLVCGTKLSNQDFDVIKKTTENPSKIIEESLIRSLNDIKTEFEKDHVSALGWMIANGKLEIKIAATSENIGIFHPKVGILKDNEGNGLSFSGSENETSAAWKFNTEEFKVFKNWINGQKQYFEEDLAEFNKFWHDKSIKTKVVDLPMAVKNKLIEISPSDIKNINLKKYYQKNYKNHNKIILRKYQKEAILNWYDNDKKGIFEMATGTGKTITALSCFKKVLDENDDLLTVIACPQSHLIDQWIKDIKKFYNGKILIASSKNRIWKKEFKRIMRDSYMGLVDDVVIITTHRSLSSDYFTNCIKQFKNKILLIVDEVHGIGSSKQSSALIERYNFRLGLSATPQRWFDEEGTNFLMDYFNNVVFEFNIGRALTEINPESGKTYLTPYIYKPIVVDLTYEEFNKYRAYTRQIANIVSSKNKNKNKEKLKNLCIKRKNIINNAEEKLNAFAKILKENKNISDLIVYCSPQQINKVQEILIKENITPQHRFTKDEKVIKSKNFNGLTEREYIIKNFEEGSYRALVAIKCLDEGVDIPSARTGIILSSTSNPREHVQRRGRLLRRYPGKEEAIIYDILVFPKDNSEIGAKITKKEIERYNEFAYNAKNSFECLKVLKKYYEAF